MKYQVAQVSSLDLEFKTILREEYGDFLKEFPEECNLVWAVSHEQYVLRSYRFLFLAVFFPTDCWRRALSILHVCVTAEITTIIGKLRVKFTCILYIFIGQALITH
jgi:hypothetical protein